MFSRQDGLKYSQVPLPSIATIIVQQWHTFQQPRALHNDHGLHDDHIGKDLAVLAHTKHGVWVLLLHQTQLPMIIPRVVPFHRQS